MRWPILLKALPELFSAALLFVLWVEPQRVGLDWFRSGVLALLLEFFVIHASGFMAVLMYDPATSARMRSLQVGGLGAGYLLFVGAIAWGLDAWWMLGAFAWLCFSKLDVPLLGATAEVRDAAGFNASGGVWEAEPHRALAGAVLYFTLMGLSRPFFALAQNK